MGEVSLTPLQTSVRDFARIFYATADAGKLRTVNDRGRLIPVNITKVRSQFSYDLNNDPPPNAMPERIKGELRYAVLDGPFCNFFREAPLSDDWNQPRIDGEFPAATYLRQSIDLLDAILPELGIPQEVVEPQLIRDTTRSVSHSFGRSL